MMTEEAALKVHFDAKILIYSVAQNRKVVHRKPVFGNLYAERVEKGSAKADF